MSNPGLAKTDPIIPAVDSVLGALALAKAKTPSQETSGQRLARLRRERGLTQGELAHMLGVTQPMISDYERDELRLHGELLVELSAILKTTADELLGLEKSSSKAGIIKNRRLYRRLQAIEKLPKRDQEALLRTIDAFLSKAS